MSGGKWTISIEGPEDARIHKLRWWHNEGIQDIKIKGVVRKYGKVVETEEEGYLSQFWQNGCMVM